MVFDRTAVAPIARQVPHVHTCHGDERQDPYFWLHQRDDEAVLTFLRAQNDYADALMAPTDALQKTLYAEMRGRIKEDELSAPYRDGDYWYYTRYEAGHEYPIYARRLGSMDADEQIILDVNVLAQGHDYCAVSGVEVSPDHQRVAYAIDTVGRRQYTLHCIEIGSGESIAQPLPGMSPGAIWNADCSDVFAVRNDPETLRPFEVLLHGQTQNAHPVWQEQDDTFAVYVSGTCTEAYVQLVSVSTLTTEIHLIPTSEPLRQPEVFLARRRGHEYYLDHDGEQFYVISNREAKNFCLMATQAPGTPIDAWREISAHNPSELLEDFQLFKHAIVLQFKRDGLTGYRVIDRASGATHEIEFDDPAWLTGLRDNIMFDAPALRFEYESMTTPATVFDYDLTTHERTVSCQTSVR
ncbi:MAG: oligopeptidase B, partial [Pseudomonadota bacterium]